MDQEIDIPRLIRLRKVTRVISDQLSTNLSNHLTILKPLFDPVNTFGQFIRGQTKITVTGADKDFQKLKELYSSVASSRPFLPLKELESQLDVFGASIEINPLKYDHVVTNGDGKTTITVISPMKWIISYKNLGLDSLRKLIAGQDIAGGVDLRECVLHYLALHFITFKKPGIATLLEALRHPVASVSIPEFAQLPIPCVSCPISTVLPADDIIIQSTEQSGTSAFEEVININDIPQMKDPLGAKIIDLIKQHDESMLSEIDA